MNNLFNNLSNSYQQMLPNRNAEPIKVHGVESAKAYPTLPNSKIILFDDSEDVFYFKETDASNYPFNFKIFAFTEVQPDSEVEAKYVTIEEFNQFKEELLNGKQFIWNEPVNSTNDATNGEQRSTNTKDDGHNGARPITSTNASKSNKSKSSI